jgi:hypothetical protein
MLQHLIKLRYINVLFFQNMQPNQPTYYVRFQVLTAATMKLRFVFWDVLPCKIIVDRRFRGTWRQHVPMKRR